MFKRLVVALESIATELRLMREAYERSVKQAELMSKGRIDEVFGHVKEIMLAGGKRNG